MSKPFVSGLIAATFLPPPTLAKGLEGLNLSGASRDDLTNAPEFNHSSR